MGIVAGVVVVPLDVLGAVALFNSTSFNDVLFVVVLLGVVGFVVVVI